MDFFNLFNRAQFKGDSQGFTPLNPTLDNNATVGTSNTVISYNPNPAYGVSSQDKGPREIQYGIKFTF
jgi:hypothetical protein